MSQMQGARELRSSVDFLAQRISSEHFRRFPDLAARYGEYGRKRCVEDAAFHLSFLAAAVDANVPAIFTDYVAWAKTVLVSRGVPASDLLENLRTMSDVLEAEFPGETSLRKIIDEAITKFADMPEDVPSFIDESTDTGRVAKSYLDQLIAGDQHAANREIALAIDRGLNVIDVCSNVFETVQHEVGRLWQLNKISVAVEHFCTAVTQRTLAQACGMRAAQVRGDRKRVLAMCAPGEQHDFGLHVLTELLALEGWQTFFLGANVPATAASQMCADRNIDVLLISASLPPRIGAVTEVVRLVRENPKTKNIRIIVGGNAFNRNSEVWRVTGADAFARSGRETLELLRN